MMGASVLLLLVLLCITATSASQDWLEKRNNVIHTIWTDGSLPLTRAKPDKVEATNVTGMMRVSWTMKSALLSLEAVGYHHRRSTTKQSRNLVIMHMGHSWSNWDYNKSCFRVPQCYNESTGRCDHTCRWWDFMNTTTWLHDELEMDYIDLFMPLMWPNHLPDGVAGLEHDGAGNHTSHEWFRQWQAKGDKPLRFFIEPVVLATNYALQTLGYASVHLFGLSGGGWTTTIAAALDPRIRLSIPVAGSLPWYLFGAHVRGDYEQDRQACDQHTCHEAGAPGTCSPDGRSCADWYLTQANFTELYLLAALEPGRCSLQVLHENDPVAFHARTRHAAILGYGERISATLDAAAPDGHGLFSTAVVDWNQHEYDPHSKEVIHAALAQCEGSQPRFDQLPCDILQHGNVTRASCPWPPPRSDQSYTATIGSPGEEHDSARW